VCNGGFFVSQGETTVNRRKVKTIARYVLASMLLLYGSFVAFSGGAAQVTMLASVGLVGLVVTAASDLRKERAKAHDRQTELLAMVDKPVDDRPGKLTNEQIDSEYTALDTKIGEFDKQIEDADKWAGRKNLNGERDKRLRQSQGFAAPPNDPGEQGQRHNERIEVTEGFEDDPKRGFKNHREFLTTVMETGRTGRLEDKRLRFLATGSDEQSTVSDPYGGFLLPVGFSPNLLSLESEGDPTMGRTTPIPMTTQSIEIPARVDKNHTSSVSGGLQVYRRNETDTSSASRMQFEQVKLNASMLFGIAYATEELLARSPISFVALLEAGFRDEFATKLLKEKLFGTGAGQYEGVVNAPGTVSQAKENGQGAATINKENIDKMRSRCWRYGQAIWLYNHDCLPMLRSLVQNVGTGGAVVPYFQTTPDGNSTLDGRPAFASEFCETLGTVGDLILGNWSQYLEGTLTNMQEAESIHVRFINHERTFKFWMENDGRCWWRSALTPNQSSNTLSPFVTLQTRA
jgi:HK97 family phage major capsid protein